MRTSLVVMAAGLGSRFKGGVKQLQPVGPNGEVIMDYSISDAIKAGFDKVVFIIRRDIYDDFVSTVGDRVSKYIQVDYVFQDVLNIPDGYNFNERVKPWGTGHAILCLKDKVREPFCVINADDYYGREAFILMHEFLVSNYNDYDYAMIGYRLRNTLSLNGSVNRGVCKVNDNELLIDVKETFNIEYKNNILTSDNNSDLDLDMTVSMGMYGFKPSIIDELEIGFKSFLDNLSSDDLKSEYILPSILQSMIDSKKASVKVIPTCSKWLGMTYLDDVKGVKDSFKKLYVDGIYKDNIYEV